MFGMDIIGIAFVMASVLPLERLALGALLVSAGNARKGRPKGRSILLRPNGRPSRGLDVHTTRADEHPL